MSFFVAAAMLAGCGGLQRLGAPGATPATSPGGERKTWMNPNAKKLSRLLYISDVKTNSVFVYDYPSGTEVGDLTTDIDGPYGQCVDRMGDVYISSFGSSETVEFAHGGSTPIAEFSTPGGYPVGCAVDRQGDLAVANLYSVSGPAALYVWTHGEGTPTEYQYGDQCLNMYPPGYDENGDVIVECVGYASKGNVKRDWNTSIVCALLKGATSLTTLSFNQSIGFASGTMWDGKYIALGDQNHNNSDETAIYQASLSGSTLTLEGTTVLGDTCGGDVVQPFIVGEKNAPVNEKQGKVVIGASRNCIDTIPFWHYPASGDPFKTITGPELPYGQSVSIAE
ncbi:MAG TPA: hypothetical protein VKR56_03910 [Candidatus Cybelea sp.]|nr:hypothetical protein [Candidatus Cybelea sp.]